MGTRRTVEELSKLYEIYLKSVSKLCNIEYDKPFKVRHIAHDNKTVREKLNLSKLHLGGKTHESFQ